MSGVAFTTISPSRTNSSRNTPWVDGCCGPIEIVICVSNGESTTSNCGGMFTVALITQDCHRGTETQRTSDKEISRRVLKFLLVLSMSIFFVPLCLWGELFQAVGFITTQRKILAQCVPLPVVGQKNSSEIGMALEDHSKEIIRLALVPV